MQHAIKLNEHQINVIETAARVFSIDFDEVIKRSIDDQVDYIEDALVKSGHITWND